MSEALCLYFEVHQPRRLRPFKVFDIGSGAYFDDALNRDVFRKVAEKCYLPAGRLLLRMLSRHADFKVAFSLSGVFLEGATDFAPSVLPVFRDLMDVPRVSLLGETYAHSLSAVHDRDEFEAQVALHGEAVASAFGRHPRVFRNTELIYRDSLAPHLRDMGFDGALVEGAAHVLEWRSPNFVYEAASAPGFRLLPRNFSLSDDVGFRFQDRSWSAWPLSADTFLSWIKDSRGDVVNIFIDYETFGEHQWAESGIFDFLASLPQAAERREVRFETPDEQLRRTPVAPLSFPRWTSWADRERDLSAWLGNGLQRSATDALYALKDRVLATGDARLVADWRSLTTSDHVYYLSTKFFSDGEVHAYFNPFPSPYDAFIAFMNVLEDLKQRIQEGDMDGRSTARKEREGP